MWRDIQRRGKVIAQKIRDGTKFDLYGALAMRLPFQIGLNFDFFSYIYHKLVHVQLFTLK